MMIQMHIRAELQAQPEAPQLAVNFRILNNNKGSQLAAFIIV